MKIVLVGCSKQKRASGTWAARDLYTSPLFRKARAWAEAVGDGWDILSAAHGLVMPGTLLEPYNVSAPRTRQGRIVWAREVARVLGMLDWPIADTEIVILAGARYADPLAAELRARGYRVTLPLRGMGIGERLHYLTCIPGRPREPAGRCDWCGGEFPELCDGKDHEDVPRRWCPDCAIDPCCPCPDDCDGCDNAHCREDAPPPDEIRARLRPEGEGR